VSAPHITDAILINTMSSAKCNFVLSTLLSGKDAKKDNTPKCFSDVFDVIV